MNDHADVLWTLLTSVIALIKVTRWGQAHAQALKLVMTSIEETDSRLAKLRVSSAESSESAEVQDVISSTAQTVDPKVVSPSPFRLFLRIAVNKLL